MRTLGPESGRDGSAAHARAVRRSGSHRRWALPAAVVLVGALVGATHWPVLHARALSLDDAAFVTQNPLVSAPGWPSVRRFFVEVLRPSTVSGYYLPISMTSLMVDYAMGGRAEDPYVFHRTSLFLHVLNAALILLLLYRLFGSVVPAAIAALLFGLHPLTVEPVAWIGERKTLLATLFALGCLLCYVELARGKGRAWLTASLALYLLALLSKPTVTTLPVLLLVLDYWPLRRSGARAVYSKWPFVALSLASAIVTFISHQRTAGLVSPDFARWPVHAGYLLAFYLGKILWPQNLSCAYPQPEPFALANPVVLLSVVAVILLTILLVAVRRRAPEPLAGWSFFVIAIAPTLGLIQYSWVIASDKYVYFPAIGLLMAIAAATSALLQSPRFSPATRTAILLLVGLMLAGEAHGVRATLRNWADSMTLYRQMEKTAPDSYVVQAQLGVLLEKRAEHREAIAHLRRAIALMPGYGEAHYNLGITLAGQGQLEEAIEHLRIADRLIPDDPATIYNLGQALGLAGRLDEAAEQFGRAVRLNPHDVRALDALGGALVMQGRPGEAVERFRAALSAAPDDPNLHYRYSMALLVRGGSAGEAAGHLREAIRLNPDWPQPLNALAWLLATSPDLSVRDGAEALRLASRAVELTGSRDPLLLDTRAAALAASGRFAEAVATERDALELLAHAPTDTLAAAMRERLKLYQRGSAYLEPVRAAAPSPR